MRNFCNHAFVRHADPHFGSAFGGGCAEQVDSIVHGRVTCGFPESSHPAQPRSEQCISDTRPKPDLCVGDVDDCPFDHDHEVARRPDGGDAR